MDKLYPNVTKEFDSRAAAEQWCEEIRMLYRNLNLEEPMLVTIHGVSGLKVELKPPPPADAPIRRLAEAWQRARKHL